MCQKSYMLSAKSPTNRNVNAYSVSCKMFKYSGTSRNTVEPRLTDIPQQRTLAIYITDTLDLTIV